MRCGMHYTNYLPKRYYMNNKFLSGIILGAVAGAALALFLTSDKGKEIIEDLKEAADDAADTARGKFNDANDELHALLAKGKAFVNDLEQKIKEAKA